MKNSIILNTYPLDPILNISEGGVAILDVQWYYQNKKRNIERERERDLKNHIFT